MRRSCPECGAELTVVVAGDEMAPPAGQFRCSECQIAYRVDATNALVELEP